jgi:co-chaperonin GroES (HSP10)
MRQDVSSIDLSRGDVVLFSSIGAIPIEVRGREYVIIESEDVLMILDKGDYDAE